jgi:hypothetical protein
MVENGPKMNAWRFVICALILTASGLVACSSNGSNSTTPAKLTSCVLPAGTTVTMVYPIPNTTGVPDNISQIVLAANPALPSSWQTVMTVDNVNFVPNGQVVTAATPLPTPNSASGTFTGTYQSSAVSATLQKGATTIVYLNDTAQSCNSFSAVGSFTEQ